MQYLSTTEIAELYEIDIKLVKKQCGLVSTLKQKINGVYCYPVNHSVITALIRYGKGGLITATSAKQDFKLKEKDLEKLICTEVKNPHYSSAKPMRLYYRDEVTLQATEKA